MNVDGNHPHLVFHAAIQVLDGGAVALVETLVVPVILDDDLSPMRTAISSLRRKLGDDGKDPTYIFTEIRVGYRMPRGETREREMQRESPRHHRDNSEGSNHN